MMNLSMMHCRFVAGWAGLVTLMVLAFQPAEALAQNPSQTSRAFVPSAAALAMGDAGVALPGRETVFFYNPAHLTRVTSARPRFTLIGIRGALSSNLFDQIAFFEDELEPALSEGIDSTNTNQMRELYDAALAVGRRKTVVNGDLFLPSVMVQIGDVGIGAGAFGHSTLNYHLEDAGAGIPLLNFSAMGDLIFVGSAAVDLGMLGIDGLAAGLSGKMMQRWLTMKNKPLDAFGSEEHLLLFKASAVGFDVGLLYDATFVPLPGDFTLGFAAYDVIGSEFDYAFDRSMTSTDEPSALAVSEEEESVNTAYAVAPSFRLGAGYSLPEPLGSTVVTLDYLWYATPHMAQTAPAHVHVGAESQIGFARLRAGLNSGYTTLGGGLDFGFVAFDYAFYGIEQGRFPGQLPSWNHSAQLSVRI